MTDKNPTEISVETSPQSPAVGDGYVDVVIERMNSWANVSHNYQKLQTGTTSHGLGGGIVVRVPVPGVNAGEPISPAHASVLLVSELQMSLPACKLFVEQVENQYGYDPNDW